MLAKWMYVFLQVIRMSKSTAVYFGLKIKAIELRYIYKQIGSIVM